jgi:hypothetical protein
VDDFITLLLLLARPDKARIIGEQAPVSQRPELRRSLLARV